MASNASSKNAFLDRFTGKIGFITKHGDLINPDSVSHTKKSMMARSQNSCSLHFKQNKLFPPIKEGAQQRLDLSMTMQRRETQSLYSKYVERQPKYNARTSAGSRKIQLNQKFANIGVNLLNRHTEDSGQNIMGSKFPWRKDIQSKQSYRGLAALQMSKATSFKNNPLVHL